MTDPKPPQTQDELENYLPYLVNRFAMLGQASQSKLLSASGLNLVVMRILSILYIEDRLTVNETAARTFTEQSSASRTIDSMVSQGLVDRIIPEHDQRQRVIVLTALGRQRLIESWPAMAQFFDIISGGITDAERKAFRSVITRMLANLDRISTGR